MVDKNGNWVERRGTPVYDEQGKFKYKQPFPHTDSEMAKNLSDYNIADGEAWPMSAEEKWKMRPEDMQYYMAVQNGNGPYNQLNYSVDDFDKYLALRIQGCSDGEARRVMMFQERYQDQLMKPDEYRPQ